jgi:hypothetical protein
MDSFVPPSEAYGVAVQELDNWKAVAKRESSSLSLDGEVHLIEGATLGHAFIKYRMFPEDIWNYIESDTLDPTAFARHFEYIFPIMSDGVYLGALRVAPTRRGSQPGKNIGYILSGIDDASHDADTKVLSARKAIRTPGIEVTGYIRFRAPRTDLYVVLQSGKSRYFLPGMAVTPVLSSDRDSIALHAVSPARMGRLKEELRSRLSQ